MKLVRQCGQAFLESLAVASDHRALWLASISVALFLHAAFFISFVAISIPENSFVTAVERHEISLEFDVVSDELAGTENYSQSSSNFVGKDFDMPSVDPPIISSLEAKYSAEENLRKLEAGAQSEGMQQNLKKDTPPQDKNHSTDLSNSTQATVGVTVLESQTQNARQIEQRIRKTWEKQLVAHLARYRSYPTVATNQNAQVTLSFILDRSGHVVSAAVVKSSGQGAIDQAALTMMQRADPVPPPPASVAAKGLNFSLPIVFTLNTNKKNLPRNSK